MASNALYILLCSGEHEKIQMAAMMASVAAVSERSVEVFVSMNAMLAFARDVPAGRRYSGGRFSELLRSKHAPDSLAIFRQGKELGDLKMWACSMALERRGLGDIALGAGLVRRSARPDEISFGRRVRTVRDFMNAMQNERNAEIV